MDSVSYSQWRFPICSYHWEAQGWITGWFLVIAENLCYPFLHINFSYSILSLYSFSFAMMSSHFLIFLYILSSCKPSQSLV